MAHMDLNEAVYAGREDIVINLLNSGRDVNMNPTGTTALMTASSWATKNMVRLLLERGADVNIVNRYNGATALMLASDTCRGQIAKLLLDNGANVNAADLSGNTSLIKASLCRHENIVRLLLQRGADVNVVNNDGKAALDIAQERGYHNIVRLLHQHGAQRLPADWTELCDDLSEAGIEELRDILRNDVTAENYTTVAEAFELTSTEPTEENILRFKNSLKRYTKPQLCARLAQYYYQCRDKIDAISLENWFEDYRSYGSVFVTADRNCYNVENLYQSTLRNHIDPLTRRELTPRELETLNIRRERIRRSRR